MTIMIHADKFEKGANWWIHCLTGNYLSRWYYHTIGDVKSFQAAQEEQILDGMRMSEAEALNLLQRRSSANASGDEHGSAADAAQAAIQYLQNFQEATAIRVLAAWYDFFFLMAGKYRDMYKVVDIHAENFISAYSYLTVPRQWLELIGFWGQPGSPPPGAEKPIGIRPINIPAEDSPEAYGKKYPEGMSFTYSWPYNSRAAVAVASNRTSLSRVLDVIIGMVAGIIVALIAGKLLQRRHPYLPIR
jgi:hypothetical protein